MTAKKNETKATTKKDDKKAEPKKDEPKAEVKKEEPKAEGNKDESKKDDARSDAKADANADVKAEAKKDEPKHEAKAEAKKDEPRKDEAKKVDPPKLEAKVEAKVDAKADAKLDAKKDDAKSAAKPDAKSEPKKDEPTKAKFTLQKPSGHTNYYGLVFGGSALEGAQQAYNYFVVAQNGTFLINQRNGEATPTLQNRTPHAAIKQPDAAGTSTNTLEVRVAGDTISYVVNDQVVHTMPKGNVKTDGLVGARVNHMLDVTVKGVEVVKK